MYCPWCGDEMVMVGRELTCRRGNMGLSQFLETVLKERFPPVSRSEPVPSISASGFFCPGCGVPMISGAAVGTSYTCPKCGKALDPGIMHQLVELHPHGYEIRGYKNAVRTTPSHG